jgi:hypothetical protein
MCAILLDGAADPPCGDALINLDVRARGVRGHGSTSAASWTIA